MPAPSKPILITACLLLACSLCACRSNSGASGSGAATTHSDEAAADMKRGEELIYKSKDDFYPDNPSYAQAADEFRAVLRSEPDNHLAALHLADALIRTGKDDEAMAITRDLKVKLDQQETKR